MCWFRIDIRCYYTTVGSLWRLRGGSNLPCSYLADFRRFILLYCTSVASNVDFRCFVRENSLPDQYVLAMSS